MPYLVKEFDDILQPDGSAYHQHSRIFVTDSDIYTKCKYEDEFIEYKQRIKPEHTLEEIENFEMTEEDFDNLEIHNLTQSVYSYFVKEISEELAQEYRKTLDDYRKICNHLHEK